MPKKNRVTPNGEIIASTARGSYMGNRGVLHDYKGELTAKRWTHQQWIICLLKFKGRKRQLMAPGCYTELFFLDEATALAAGHRPCWECNRERYTHFKYAWLAGNPEYDFDARTSIKDIDKVLHSERVDRFKKKPTWSSALSALPNGVMVSLPDGGDASYLVNDGQLRLWSPGGYGQPQAVAGDIKVSVLTPLSTVNAILAGYEVQLFDLEASR
jgi:hypothetical protein